MKPIKPSVATRAEYLAFVLVWKSAYARLSTAIRLRKKAERAIAAIWANGRNEGISSDVLTMRAGEHGAVLKAAKDIILEVRGALPPSGAWEMRDKTSMNFIHEGSSEKDLANFMLSLRKHTKKEAHAAYLRDISNVGSLSQPEPEPAKV